MEAVRSSPNVRHRFSHGEAIQDLMVDEYLPYLIETPVADRDEATAPFSLDTFIIAEEGKTISGDDIHRIIQEAKAKGVTIASLAHTVPNAISKVIVSEGPGVVEPAPRSPRRKKGDASD